MHLQEDGPALPSATEQEAGPTRAAATMRRHEYKSSAQTGGGRFSTDAVYEAMGDHLS
jgi:hypothetical protein